MHIILIFCCSYAFLLKGHIDLDAGGKAFFEPVVAFSKVYTPVAIFIGGVAGLAFTPGEPKTKIAGAAGGMALGGLLIKAAEKAFGIV